MKLRYYLRGLGIGILVTALFFSVSEGNSKTMSEEEIKARATELGMVESNSLTLADIKDRQDAALENQEAKADKPAAENKEAEKTEAENSAAAESTEQESPDKVSEGSEGISEEEAAKAAEEMADEGGAESAAESEEPAEMENTEGQETVTVTIERGQTSYGVSLLLEELGLVADAEAFDDYLCDRGYSKKVRYGVYHIVVGTSEEKLADIISGN